MPSGSNIILLIGVTGQVGGELKRALAPLGHVVATNRHSLDLADSDTICRVIRDTVPGLIVNAAGYTQVDQAEDEPERAMAINGTAPGIMAEEAKRLAIPLVHYSTDYVFDGTGNAADGIVRPYRETDLPAPLSEYGRSKLAGEEAIQAVSPIHLILRTSGVYSNRGVNFLHTVRALASAQQELQIVDDQIVSPTWARVIAAATAEILRLGWTQVNENSGVSLGATHGLYHLSAAGSTTWCEFARAIVEADVSARRGRQVRVNGISTEDYPLPAIRPAYSVLDNSALETAFGIKLPDWHDQLVACLEEGQPDQTGE